MQLSLAAQLLARQQESRCNMTTCNLTWLVLQDTGLPAVHLTGLTDILISSSTPKAVLQLCVLLHMLLDSDP